MRSDDQADDLAAEKASEKATEGRVQAVQPSVAELRARAADMLAEATARERQEAYALLVARASRFARGGRVDPYGDS